MSNYNQDKLTKDGVAAFANTPDPRLRQLMSSLVRHPHAFARETDLRPEASPAPPRFLPHPAQPPPPARAPALRPPPPRARASRCARGRIGPAREGVFGIPVGLPMPEQNEHARLSSGGHKRPRSP